MQLRNIAFVSIVAIMLILMGFCLCAVSQDVRQMAEAIHYCFGYVGPSLVLFMMVAGGVLILNHKTGSLEH